MTRTKAYKAAEQEVNKAIAAQAKAQAVTPDSYYSILSSVQNAPELQGIDIVTFTAFLDWNEKLTHLTRYIARLETV